MIGEQVANKARMGNALHLLVDGLAREPLTEQQVIDFLMAMPSREYLDMTLILGPKVYKTQGGWAGVCIIAESHVSIHCQDLTVHADIFSCRPFDVRPVTNYCRDQLELGNMVLHQLKRGWDNWGVEI